MSNTNTIWSLININCPQHEEEMRALRRPKDLEVEYYLNQLRDVYNKYLELHNPIIDHYNYLREKDSFYQKDIAKNENLIEQTAVSYLCSSLN